MKLFRFAAVLFAIAALSAMVVVSAASALPTFLLAEWLEGGVATSETMLVETSGELLLEDTNAPTINKPAAVKECSGILDGFVGTNGADEVTELLTLGGLNVTPLGTNSIACKPETACEKTPKAWALGLPWLTLAELWEEGTESGFVDLITTQLAGGKLGWEVECEVLLIKTTEQCETPEAAASLSNAAEGVLGEFSEAFTVLMGLKLAVCNGNGGETGIVEGDGVTKNSLAGLLEVSSQ